MIYKKEFTEAIAEEMGVTKSEAGTYYSVVFKLLKEMLERGEEVALPDIGRFKVIDKSEKECFNPKTREKMTVPAHKICKFTPARNIKEAVKGL